MFRHLAFGDERPLAEQTLGRFSVEERRGGRYELVRILIEGEWVVVEQRRAGMRDLAPTREATVPLTRGMLGVSALVRRRRVLAAADRLWASVSENAGLRYHPYCEERRLLRTPGAYVHDRAMLIFRTRPDYARPATRAQAASFRWLWPLHSATLLGDFRNYLAAQDLSRPALRSAERALTQLQAHEIAAIPASMRSEGPRGPAMASMLARVFCLMLAREQRTDAGPALSAK